MRFIFKIKHSQKILVILLFAILLAGLFLWNFPEISNAGQVCTTRKICYATTGSTTCDGSDGTTSYDCLALSCWDEKVCTYVPDPPPYIPPPVVPNTLTPTEPPRQDPPPAEPVCPCGKDGIGNCIGSCPVSVPDCYDKFGPVYLRVVSNEGSSGTISWKTGEPVKPMLNGWNASLPPYWSVNPSSGGGLDAEGYFKQYKPYYNDPLIKTFDKSKNKIDNSMQLVALNDNIVHETKSWSNHFCGKGYAFDSDASGNYPNGECKLSSISCSGSNGVCRKWCMEDNDGCLNWPKLVNGVETYQGENFLNMSNPPKPPENGGEKTDKGNIAELTELLKEVDPMHWADLKYDEYWSLSFWARYAKRHPAISEMCTEERVEFEFTPPTGYGCKNVKFYSRNGNTVEDLTRTVGFQNISSDPRKCKFSFIPDRRGSVVLVEVQPDTNCTVNASPNVQCSADGRNATVSWSPPANNTVFPDRIVNRVNKDPFTDWYNDTYDKFISLTPADTSSTFSVDPGGLYNFKISYDKLTGTNVYETKCESPTISFTCQPPRANLCSSSTLLTHNFGNSFAVSSKASQPVKNMVHVFYNPENLDVNNNPKPVCITSTDPSQPGYAAGCPAGSEQLRYYYDMGNNPTDTFNRDYKYNEVFVADTNFSNRILDKVLVKAYFSDPAVNGGQYSAEDSKCNLTIDKFTAPVVNPTCYVPDPQVNSDSASCSDVLRPLIQKRAGDMLTIQNGMRGIDPTTQIKFDWVDSVPANDSDCSALYSIVVWEVNPDGTDGAVVLSFFVNQSEYTLDANRLDFGKRYRWQVKAVITQASACSMLETTSYNYEFTTNSFPFYLKSGVAFDRNTISNDTSANPNVNSGQIKCDGNVNCTNFAANTNSAWGGIGCYSGNPKYGDTQPPAGAKRIPDNPITYWFDYADAENYASSACLQNEMMVHRLAIVKKNDIAKLGGNQFTTQDSVLEIRDKIANSQIDGILVEFDVSEQTAVKTANFNSAKANITATRYLDALNRMRVVYDIEFLAGMNTNEYEIFGSMVGTAFDPRGAAVRSSILMYDIPYDWDISGSSIVSGAVDAVTCTGTPTGDDGDDDCTCPGSCCDKFEDKPNDEPDKPEPPPLPGDPPKPNPTPKPVPKPTQKPKPTPKPGGGGGGCSSDDILPHLCP
jgi:hypothetical protein